MWKNLSTGEHGAKAVRMPCRPPTDWLVNRSDRRPQEHLTPVRSRREPKEEVGRQVEYCFISLFEITETSPAVRGKIRVRLQRRFTRPYEDYHKVAEGYHKKFLKRYKEDSCTTLTFLRCTNRSDTRVLARITGWSVLRRHSRLLYRLRPVPNKEAAVLLRVIFHTMSDNTTFGRDAPAVSQWSGPPRTIVQVRAILYASHNFTLPAFLATPDEQRLNSYSSIDAAGTGNRKSTGSLAGVSNVMRWGYYR